MEILKFTFESFWHFAGVFSILYILLYCTINAFNRFFRHWNIRKHGYPPSHCDADGDFKEIDKLIK